MTVPADTYPLSDRLIPYFNALGRWYLGQRQNSEAAKAENAAQIGRDQKLSFEEIKADQWADAPGGSKDAAWGALVGDGRDAFVRWMESRQKRTEQFQNYEPGVTLSDMPATYDFGRPGFPPDPASVYVGLALSNDFDVATRWLKAGGSTLLGWDQTAEAKKHLQLVHEFQGRIDALPMSEAATRFDKTMAQAGKDPTISGQLSKIGAAISNDPGGLLAYVTEKGTESIPDLAMAAIVTAVTKNPAAGIALSAGLTYRQERSSAALALIEEKGFDLSKSADIERLLADSAVWKEVEKRGYTSALLATLADIASGGVGEAKFFKTALVNGVVQHFAAPAASMAGETLAQVYSGQKLNAATIALNGAVAVFKTAASKAMDAGLEKLPEYFNKAHVAEENFRGLLEMSEKSGAVKLRVQDPESFQALITDQLRGSKAKFIFIRANDLDHLLATSDLDVRAIFDPLKGFDKREFNNALAAGGDVRMPTATYLAYIAPTMGIKVSPYVHVGDPSNWNFGETQAFYEALRETSQGSSPGANGKAGAESSPAVDAPPKATDPATAALTSANGGMQGGEGGAAKASDAIPSGAISESSSPSAARATAIGGSDTKAVPNQNQTLPAGSGKLLNSASPGAIVRPETTVVVPEGATGLSPRNAPSAELNHLPKDERSPHAHVDHPPLKPEPGADRGARLY